MPRPVLVLDLDGTLADTRLDLIPVLNRVTALDGLAPVDLRDVGHIVGHGALAMIRFAFEHHGQSISEARQRDLFRIFLEDYEANIAANTVLFDGVETCLNQFEGAGWKLAVCTNKMEHLARKLLDELGLRTRFDAITGGDTFENRKPHRDHILKTIEMAGGEPAQSIMVGDSITDIDAARQSGVPVVAVTFGYSSQPIESLGPDRTISHFDQLWDCIQSI